MKTLSFFVNRPIATIMILMTFLFFGIISFFKIPRDLFPNVSHPQLTIVTKQENTSSEEIEKNITKPLEEELSFLKNLYTMNSISEEGVSRIQLTFHWGTNMDFSALETREKVDAVKEKFPEEAEDPLIERYNPNAQPVLMINVTGSQNEIELRNAAQNKIKPPIERMLGVAQVKVFGGSEKEIEVSLNPHALKSHSLSAQDVIDALKRSNITSRGGVLREGKIDLLIKTESQFTSLEDISNTIVSTQNQKPIYLKNLSWIKEKPKIKKDFAYLNGKTSVSLAIYKEPSGNSLSISRNLHNLIEYLEEEAHVKLLVSYDQSDYIKNAFSLVQSNAFQAAFLTTGVLFLFLRNFWTTVIILLSIPFSIICAFFLLYLNNVSLNIFSLAGVALAIGIVVDAATVILENIFTHIQNQTKPKIAAVNASMEVSGAVIASTLTTIVVFIPILFVKGPIGIIFKDLSLSIIYGVSFSLLVAFSLIPMLAGQFLKVPTQEKIEEKIDRWKNLVLQVLNILDHVYLLGSKIAKGINKILSLLSLTPDIAYQKAVEKTKTGEKNIQQVEIKIEKQYERTLKQALKSRQSKVSVLAAVFFLFIVSLIFMPKTEFLPESLQTHYEITLTYPLGSSLSYTEKESKKIEKFVLTVADIESTNLKIIPGKSSFIVKFLKPKKAQKRLNKIRDYLEKIPDTYFSIAALSPLSSITAGLETRTIDIKLKGPDIKILQDKSKILVEELKKMDGINSAHSLYQGSKPEIEIKVDREKISNLMLSSQAIADSIKHQLYGTKATTMSFPEAPTRDLAVMVRSQAVPIDTTQKLGDLLIPSPLGTHIPLSSLASFEEKFLPQALSREEKERTLTVMATIDPSVSPHKIISSLPRLRNRLSMPSGYSLQMGPQVKLFQKSFYDLKIALIISIILIYVIMAAQFESLLHPFTILFSVPLSFIGITASLLITGKFLSISAFIGIIILVGISVSNGIVLVDYINILRRRGIDREEAVMLAGKRRLRPILMTSLTTIVGVLPLALGFGAGKELYQPLAIVTLGGSISSTFLTLLFIPTIYCFFDDIGDIVGIKLLKLQVDLTNHPKNRV